MSLGRPTKDNKKPRQHEEKPFVQGRAKKPYGTELTSLGQSELKGPSKLIGLPAENN